MSWLAPQLFVELVVPGDGLASHQMRVTRRGERRLVAEHPHRVQKQLGNEWVTLDEFFLTDLVEIMSDAGYTVGFVLADEEEVMGVDTPEALEHAQKLYAQGVVIGHGIE